MTALTGWQTGTSGKYQFYSDRKHKQQVIRQVRLKSRDWSYASIRKAVENQYTDFGNCQ